MAIRGTIRSSTTTLKAKVNVNQGVLSSYTPITLKNQIQEIRSIEDIKDVDEVDVTTGATLVYNEANDKYEVKQIEYGDIAGDVDIDCGEF